MGTVKFNLIVMIGNCYTYVLIYTELYNKLAIARDFTHVFGDYPERNILYFFFHMHLVKRFYFDITNSHFNFIYLY